MSANAKNGSGIVMHLSNKTLFAALSGAVLWFGIHWILESSIGSYFWYGVVLLVGSIEYVQRKSDSLKENTVIKRTVNEGSTAFRNNMPLSSNPYLKPVADLEDVDLASYWIRGYYAAEITSCATLSAPIGCQPYRSC
jgi:hypothetical protein